MKTWVDPTAVATADTYSDDTWLQVSGTFENRNGNFVIVATDVIEIPEPDQPYLPLRGL